MNTAYLDMMEDSLDNKIEVLNIVIGENEAFHNMLTNEEADVNDRITAYIDKKDSLVKKIDELNNGFTSIFEKVKEELIIDKDKYKSQIERMQDKITEISDLSVTIEAQERRNKVLIDKYFSEKRQNLNNKRKSSGAAYNYYEVMSKSRLNMPQFMDKKN
ncbi:MAG: hypothetical protein K6B41_08080 [Butyrivibrio sp.]|nr:hypothetical protein [Butyrivibrio sp.]